MPTATETARLLRAMWGYSMLEQEDFIKRLGIDLDQGRRLLRRTGAAKADEDILRRAAKAVGFSEAFAVDGAAAIAPEDPTVPERLEAIEHRLDAQLTELRGAIGELSATSLRHTRELQALRGTDRQMGFPEGHR